MRNTDKMLQLVLKNQMVIMATLQLEVEAAGPNRVSYDGRRRLSGHLGEAIETTAKVLNA